MTPTTQTRTGDKGNCFEACIATILDVPLEDVPSWQKPLDRWLAARDLQLEYRDDPGVGPVILQSFDGERYHATIWEHGILVWDPAPHPGEIGEIVGYWTLVLPVRVSAPPR